MANKTNSIHVDINACREMLGLTRAEMAKKIFPTHQYPTLALSRAVKQETQLSFEQLQRLADLLSVDVSELVGDKAEATIEMIRNRDRFKLMFTFRGFRIELNSSIWQVKLSHADGMQAVLSVAPQMGLEAFMSEVKTTVDKLEDTLAQNRKAKLEAANLAPQRHDLF